MFRSIKQGVIFEMEPIYLKYSCCWWVLSCYLVSFIYSTFCSVVNTSLLLVYNTVLSQLCHYHKSLWKGESHFSFGHVGSNSHVSICKNVTLFFNPKVLQISSLLGSGRNSCGILFVGAQCVVLFHAFFEQFFSQCCWHEKVVDSNTPPRTKRGFHYAHNHLFSLNDPCLPSVMPVYTCNLKTYCLSISHIFTFKSYHQGLLVMYTVNGYLHLSVANLLTRVKLHPDE